MSEMPTEKDYIWGFRRYQFLSFMMLGIVNPLLGPFFKSRGMDKAGCFRHRLLVSMLQPLCFQ